MLQDNRCRFPRGNPPPFKPSPAGGRGRIDAKRRSGGGYGFPARDREETVSLVQEYELLRRVPFFAEIEPAKLKLLAFMSERVGFDDGKLLCDQGDAAYLIIEGEVDIVLEGPAGPLTVATIGANEIVAEMAILCDSPRNASVRAKGRVVALRISKEPFMRMVREFPAMAVSIMRELAQRLDSTNNQLRRALSDVQRLREGAGAPAAQ